MLRRRPYWRQFRKPDALHPAIIAPVFSAGRIGIAIFSAPLLRLALPDMESQPTRKCRPATTGHACHESATNNMEGRKSTRKT